MTVHFTKMEGAGNDFLVIDCRNQVVALTPEIIQYMGHRKTGIGFDQLLLIEQAADSANDISYRIFNADGGEVQQCGNGARALAAFVGTNILAGKEIRMESMAGLILAQCLDDGGVSVNMGTPNFEPQSLPFLAIAEAAEYVLDVDAQSIEFGAVSIGNPHAVIPVNSAQKSKVQEIGEAFQNHPSFPQSVNVGFMQVVNRHHIRLRVYERGVGETLACGTGACAAVAVGVRLGILSSKVTITAPGGELLVTWPGDGQNIWLTGACSKVYEGQITI